MNNTLLQIKNTLVVLWKLLNGRKREIAKLYWGVYVPLVPILQIPVESATFKLFAIIGIVLTFLGYGHSVIKGQEPLPYQVESKSAAGE
jgi:predicted acyltransferase